ncbi:hypothetical protein [Nitrobacter sp. TKz-YC01]|uniref:hypothetical protein n=1 Tax=Nitrobacter sp. TKz-YC01 TaxID=3398703 RepID=UPI003A0FFAE9
MRIIGQIAFAICLGFLLLLASDMRFNPHSIDQMAGLILYIVTIVAVYFLFFHWRKTLVTGPSIDRRASLGIIYILIGYIQIVWRLLHFDFVSGTLAAITQLALLPAVTALSLSIMMLAAGLVLYRRESWANALARAVAFPVSLNFPLGFFLALLTWQQTLPPQQQFLSR